MRVPLVYALHSGNLYGTERMALWTAQGLSKKFDPVIMAPPGPALDEAARLRFSVLPFHNAREFVLALHSFFARNRRLVLMATGVVHSLAGVGWNLLYRRHLVHLHLVHGGTDERLSYGRKRWLNRSDVIFVAVSEFVRQRLIARGVAASKVVVIENFLPESRVRGAKRRPPFREAGIRRLLVVSRIDPNKRVDLLLDALDLSPDLRDVSVRVLGTGWDLEKLRQRAAENNPNVVFAGFQQGVAEELATSDLLVHLCPSEPFGLAILEAMAAGVPVLAPDAGGAGALVEDGISGFHFRANDASDLSAKLRALRARPPQCLNDVVRAADQLLCGRFSAGARLEDYGRLLNGVLG